MNRFDCITIYTTETIDFSDRISVSQLVTSDENLNKLK